MDTPSSSATNECTGWVDRAAPREQVLFVDDDSNVLDAFRRQFRKRFSMRTSPGGEEGLKLLRESGPFAVVVSDLHMPGMDGIAFLNAVRTQCPETIRIMLTGQADLSTAIAAVNQGNIFRFLVKPCTPTILTLVIESALEQYRLQMAERQLTEQTLLGCVDVLVEMLSIVQPDAFSRAVRLRRYIQCLAKSMRLATSWEFEAAAMLSQIGRITLRPEVVEKLAHGLPLSPEEKSHFLGHAEAASKIIGTIPRLEAVARMVAGQHTRYTDWPRQPASPRDATAALGAQMLRIATDLDELRQAGTSIQDAVLNMRIYSGVYHPDLIEGLLLIAASESDEEVRTVLFNDLSPRMVLEEDLHAKDGRLLLGKGQELSVTTLQRLRGFAQVIPFEQGIQVRVRGRRPDRSSAS